MEMETAPADAIRPPSSAFRPPPGFPVRLPPAPAPAAASQRVSHSLPLPLHLAVSAAWATAAACSAAAAHVIDGPLRASWCITTTIVHAVLKTVMQTNPPQGRHSLGVVRRGAQISLPPALIGARCDTDAAIIIEAPVALARQVHIALRLPVAEAGTIDTMRDRICHKDTPSRSVGAEWIRCRSLPADDACSPMPLSPAEHVVIYLHGGAHFFLSPRSHRYITAKISKACRASVFALDYRLAPENPFPSAVEDTLACYLALTGIKSDSLDGLSARCSPSIAPVSLSHIFIMGDSSGCCLALQLIQVLKALSLPLPGGLVLISPFLDHELKSPSFHKNWDTDFMTLDLKGMDWALDVYSNGLSRSHPAISPIYGNLSDLPPILIQSGDSEVVTDDATRFQELASAAGSCVDVELYTNMFHVFHTFPFLRESDEAFTRIGKYVDKLLMQKPAVSPILMESDSGISLISDSDSSDTNSNADLSTGIPIAQSVSSDIDPASISKPSISVSFAMTATPFPSPPCDPSECSWAVSINTPKRVCITKSISGVFTETLLSFQHA